MNTNEKKIFKHINQPAKVELKAEEVELAMSDDLHKVKKKAMSDISDARSQAQNLVDDAISLLNKTSVYAATVEDEFDALVSRINAIDKGLGNDWAKQNGGVVNEVKAGATASKKIASNLKGVKIK